MRRAKNVSGEQLFSSSEFLTVEQIASYFSRFAAKGRRQLATEQDACAAVKEENLCSARESVLTSLDLEHPAITYDQYNICNIYLRSLTGIHVTFARLLRNDCNRFWGISLGVLLKQLFHSRLLDMG